MKKLPEDSAWIVAVTPCLTAMSWDVVHFVLLQEFMCDAVQHEAVGIHSVY